MFTKVSIIAHVSQYLPCITMFLKIFSENVLGNTAHWFHRNGSIAKIPICCSYAPSAHSHCYNAHCRQSNPKSILTDNLLFWKYICKHLFKFKRRHRQSLVQHPLAVVQHHLHDKSWVLAVSGWCSPSEPPMQLSSFLGKKRLVLLENLPCDSAGCSIVRVQSTSKRSPVESKSCSIAGYCSVECRSMEWTKRSLDGSNTQSSDIIFAHTFQ